jgi:glutaminase
MMFIEQSVLHSLPLAQWQNWYQEAQAQAGGGSLPDYIPQLQRADPSWWTVQVGDSQGKIFVAGPQDLSFPLMSVIKPFLLLYLLDLYGKNWVNQQVGMQASSLPYHSLAQLEQDQGFPRNAMINSGAIALADKLPGAHAEARCRCLQDWLNDKAQTRLYLDKSLLNSVRSRPNAGNQALTALLAKSGRLQDETEALATYNHICCLTANINDLYQLGQILLPTPTPLRGSAFVRQMMLTAGLYEESAHYARIWGFACKSGVSGALLALLLPPPEQQGGIVVASYSPPLAATGHSLVGMTFLELLASEVR